MNVILIAVIVLGAIGLLASLVLFFASKKFAVHEDPRIGQVSEVCHRQTAVDVAFRDVQALPQHA